MLSLPLIGYDDTLVGVLQLLNKRAGVFDEQRRAGGGVARPPTARPPCNAQWTTEALLEPPNTCTRRYALRARSR
jgi:hypothetical protein